MPTSQASRAFTPELSLDLPGGAITEARGLLIPPDAPDELLPQIANRLLSVKGYTKWGLGAVLCEMVTRRPKHNERGAILPNEYDPGWAHEYSDAMGLDPKERREIMAVYSFYPHSEKTRGVSWEHYREAMFAVADGKPSQLPRACAYLDTAVASGLSLTQFRRAIRLGEATERPDETQPEFQGYGVVFDFRRFAARELKRIDSYTPQQATLILADIGSDAVAFITRLKAIANPIDIDTIDHATLASSLGQWPGLKPSARATPSKMTGGPSLRATVRRP